MTGTRRAALAPVLIFASMVVALISSLGAPLLPSISTHMHVALSAAQWSLTITLLAGTVSSPIMGRLGDGPHRREMIIAGLSTVTVGGVVAALASSLPVLVAGRGLQGIGLGLVPLAMAAARDHLPAERSRSTIALLSVIVAAGIGVGYPVSGLIAGTLGLSAAFWFGAAVSGLALLGVVAVVPSSKHRAAARLDVPGALLLTAGLAALLLAIADGQSWGWASPAILGLLAAAVIALTTWVFQQLHAPAPLIQLRLLRHPTVLTGDVCAIVIGVVMYMNLSGISEYVQVPKTTGYGFSASVVVAGLCLVPFSVAGFAASRALPWSSARFGQRGLLPAGALAMAAADAFFGLFHTSLWQAFVTMGLLGAGIGSTFAAIPGLIVPAVPRADTGSALGAAQVARYLGYSLGSAVTASVLAGHTPAGQSLPTQAGYTLVLWLGLATGVAGAALAWILPARHARAQQKPVADSREPDGSDASSNRRKGRETPQPENRYSPVRSASHGDEIVHGCEAAQQVAGEPLLYSRQGAHRAWPGIEAAEPHRRTGAPIASGRSRCPSRGRLEVVPAGYRAARGGPRLTDHNPQDTPAALAPVRGSSVPRARLLRAAALLLLEAIADDAPGDSDASALALERDLGLADPDRVMFPALICVSLGLLGRRAGHGPAGAALVSEVAGLLGKASGPAPPAGEPAWPCEPLTQSETRVLRYLPTHMGAPEIAAELYLSANTVKTHLRHLYRKLGAHSRQEAVQRARAIGLLTASYRRP